MQNTMRFVSTNAPASPRIRSLTLEFQYIFLATSLESLFYQATYNPFWVAGRKANFYRGFG
jgi:hypothetical protein